MHPPTATNGCNLNRQQVPASTGGPSVSLPQRWKTDAAVLTYLGENTNRSTPSRTAGHCILFQHRARSGSTHDSSYRGAETGRHTGAAWPCCCAEDASIRHPRSTGAPLAGEEDDRERCREWLLTHCDEVEMKHLLLLKERLEEQ